MDKKNTIIGLLLLMVAFTLMVFQQQPQQQPVSPEGEEGVERTVSDEQPRQPLAERSEAVVEATPVEEVPEDVEEEIVRLENDYFIVEFTNIGGAIKRVFLKDYALTKDSEERYVLNDPGEVPALGLSGLPGAGANMPYRLISQSDTEVVYGVQTAGLEITRHYSIELESGTRDPGAYTVRHETYFRNRGEQSLLLNEFGLHLGTATPTGGQTIGIQHLNFNYYDGKSFKYLTPSKFAGGGFMSWIGLSSGEPKDFIAQSLPLEWASVKNQFFASIFTPETDAKGFIARPVDLPRVEGEKPQEGITGEIVFDLRGVEAGGEQVLAGDFYAGPKEYRRLEAMGKNQDRVMQFGWPIIGFISKLLLSMMVAIAGFLPNYGVAIIVVTVLIKAVLWPLTAQAARSSRRMAKIQEPMKALREEFKDDPKRMQMETMKLFKEHQVNPVGGCLPMLVQIPIFFGLFRMIMSASELRFAEFLWVQDLSAPDTVGHLFGLPINILPFFMGASMFYQMRMMPMAMDNTQQKIFRFMPFIFFVFCYSFSSGLVLYWTVQNLLTILQHYLMRRKEDTVPVTASGSGTPQTPVQASPYLKKGKGRAAKSRKKQG